MAELSEMAQGYLDGRDPDAPDASANRSHSYRHGFMVGRNEIAGKVQPAAIYRSMAAAAEVADASESMVAI